MYDLRCLHFALEVYFFRSLTSVSSPILLSVSFLSYRSSSPLHYPHCCRTSRSRRRRRHRRRRRRRRRRYRR